MLDKLQVRNGKSDDDGGGIHVGNANLVVRDAAIVGNQALGYGGGISNLNAPGTGNVTLIRTTVAGNVTSRFGGGVMVSGENSELAIRNSIVRRNIAFQSGGGVYGERVTLTNSTFSRNYAEFSGGGILAERLTATNCTFSGNYAGSRGGGIAGGTVVLNFCTVTGNIAENGFPGIAPSSSLTLNFCTVSGNSRSVPPTLIVTTTLDVVDPADGKLSLREAITAANASVFPDTIVLPAGVFRIARSGAGEDGNATGDLDIASRMTIRGAGAGSTILNGAAARSGVRHPRKLEQLEQSHAGETPGSQRERDGSRRGYPRR